MQAEISKEPRWLEAQAEVVIADPDVIVKKIFDHFIEHEAEVAFTDEGASAVFFHGEASMRRKPDGLVMSIRARDESRLAFVKQIVAGHLMEFAGDQRPRFAWTGDGAGTTKFPNLHEMTVERIADVTPHMRRITLSGPGLTPYADGGLHVKLFIPPEGATELQLPVPGEDGIMIDLPDDVRPTVRTYSVRSVDLEAGTVDVDFVLHGDHGSGSRWALHTRPGDVVGVRGPIGRPVPEADWYLLVGDETALPVIARTLEFLPPSAKGVAIIEVADEREQQAIHFDSDIELRWLHRNGAAAGTTSLLVDAVRAVEVPAAGSRIHAMAGVEYSAFKAIRRYWRDELKLNKKDVMPVAYWRIGRAEGEADPDEEE
jgi:NADPH-dependent ferric siderophore reductase